MIACTLGDRFMAFTLKDETISFLKENPLLLETFSEEAITPRVYENAAEKAIFLGTGLTTRKAPSEGLPFDFVSYMMSAEELRQHFGFGKIYHIVADVHALSNPFMDRDYVEQLAQRVKQQAQDAAEKLGLGGVYEVKLASEFHSTPEFQAIHADTKKKVETLGLPDDAFDYVHAQIADMEYFVQHMNAGLKLSWILDPKKAREGKGFDERAFDRSYRDIFGPDRLSTAYTVSGFTADPSKLRVSPYTFAPGEQRVLMRSDFDISQFFTAIKALENTGNKGQKKAAKNVLDHMADVVSQFERVHGPVEGNELDEKVTGIINQFFYQTSKVQNLN